MLTDDLAAAMRRAAGSRYVLVHDYATVDDDIVLSRLADPTDLQHFVAAVTGWLPSAG